MGILSQLSNRIFSQMSTKALLALLAIAILVCAGGAFAITRYFKTHRGTPEQKIKEINTVISSVTSKKDLVTACYYEDLVINGTKKDLKDNPDLNKKGKPIHLDHEIVSVQGVTVSAGFKLDEMDKSNFRVEGDSIVFITLPEPVILNVVKDVDFYEEFSHRGTWSFDQVKELIILQSQDLEERAVKSGLLDRAYENGMNFFSSLFTPLEYSVQFTPRSVPAPPVEQ